MGTLLHTRRFLSYHGDRLSDASVLTTFAPCSLPPSIPETRGVS
jgi:hypothetical protein